MELVVIAVSTVVIASVALFYWAAVLVLITQGVRT